MTPHIVAALILAPFLPAPLQSAQAPVQSVAYGKLPLAFEPGANLPGAPAAYIARGSGYSIVLDSAGASLSLRTLAHTGSEKRFRLRLLEANPRAQLDPGLQLPGVSNYLIGNDSASWRTGVPQYARVTERNIYPGVDVVYYGDQGHLEYDLVVRESKSLRYIQLAFEGASGLRLLPGGDLLVSLGTQSLLQRKPGIYQLKNGRRSSLTGRYVIRSGNRVSFEVQHFDRTQPLVIDPQIIYSTFLGGSGWDEGVAIAVDASGNAYATGWTTSFDFPLASATQSAQAGGSVYGDVFVTKLNASGTAVSYSTYLGGSADDLGWGIAVDPTGSAYIGGFTGSANFPTTTGAFQRLLKGSLAGFVSKLNPAGNGLVYSTYLSGSGQDHVRGITVNANGEAYVVGHTSSSDFPITANAAQSTLAGSDDAFALKLNASGSGLIYSTLMGGSSLEIGNGIAIDSSGNAYIGGYTQSTNYPVTSGAFQTTFGGGTGDGFVTKVNPSGSAFLYSSYLGGNADDYVRAVIADSSGTAAYLAGRSESVNFPITPGAYQTVLSGSSAAFVTKLNSSGSAATYSTLIGGRSDDQAEGLAVDASGNAHIAVITQSSDYPTTSDANQRTLLGSYNGALTILNATGTGLLYSTFLGGSTSDGATNIALDATGASYLTGVTVSNDFPVTAKAFQKTFEGGSGDAFLTKFDNCFYSISPASASFTTAGGSGTFNVTTSPTCSWTAKSNVSWITITAGIAATGSGPVNFSVSNLPSTATGTITTGAGQVFTVLVTGGVPDTPTGLTASAGNGQVTLSWTAVSNASAYNVKRSTTSGGPYATIASGLSSPTYTNNGLSNGVTYYYVVSAVSSSGESVNSSQVNAQPQAPCTTCVTIWSASTIPSITSLSDSTAYELGVKFKSDVNGFVEGVRFYKGAGNTGTHIGNLWTATGTLLARATFTAETASGWQQVLFATPVSVTANTTYIASYFAPNGHYAFNQGYFTSSSFDNPPLHALSNAASGGNGVYAFSSSTSFPGSSYQASNYWVDVVLETSSTALGAPTGFAAKAGNAQTVLNWNPVTGATGYNIKRATISGGPYTTIVSTLSATTYTDTGLTNGSTYYYVVSAVNQNGESANSIQASAQPQASACATCISIWSPSTVPSVTSLGDSNPYELGLKFKSDVNGVIQGVRFYKGAGNTGTHIANLWTTSGTLLARATFTGETASGWQQVLFSTPVSITANTTYIVSCFFPKGHYAFDQGYFSTSGFDNAPLHALLNSASGGNGVYASGSSTSFPTSSYQASNYWVDFVFNAF